ncbi:MAG: glucose-6-phosphate isomerase, partial [Sphingomonadales bacterium]|nr:glucose-6-phosphate isomerase [Sphingomonadales bacterium]
MDDAWSALERTETQSLKALFAADPDRVARLTVAEAGISFDFSKTHLSRPVLDAFVRLAGEADLAGAREALFAGRIVNPTEGRAAEHSAERGQGAPESVARAG